MTIAHETPAQPLRNSIPRRKSGMRSSLAFFGSLAVLAALPLTFLTSISFGAGDGVVVHAALGTGMALLAASVFDFRVPRLLNWIGMAAMVVLATIFLSQGLAELLQSQFLFDIVYGDPTLQAVERNIAYPILLWGVGLLLTDSRGNTRIFGALSLAAVAATDLYAFWIASSGGTPDITLRLVYLLVFVWLAIEGSKPKSAPFTSQTSLPAV